MSDQPNDWHKAQSPPNSSSLSWVGGDHSSTGHLPLVEVRALNLAEYAEAEETLIAAREEWRARHAAVREASGICSRAADHVKASEAALTLARDRLMRTLPAPTPIEALNPAEESGYRTKTATDSSDS